MLITVTQEHIDKGCPRNSCWCPVAHAIMERFKVNNVRIGYRDMSIGIFPDEVIGEYIPVPKIVHDWLLAYDTNKPVTPFSFELDLSGGTNNEST